MNYPNYKHRLSPSLSKKTEDFSDTDLLDSVGLSVEEAEAILFQMQSQFEGNVDQLPDSINSATLESVRKLLLDIKTVVNWHLGNNIKKLREEQS